MDRDCEAVQDQRRACAADRQAMNSVTFTWPDKALSPNTKSHWAVKAKAAKVYRSTCYFAALYAKVKAKWTGPIIVSLEFHPPSRRHFDMDGLLSRMKSGLDGLADALQVNDSRFQLHLSIGEVVKHGAVVVTISKE